MNARGGTSRRALFVVAILTGSFLLFLVQPMVARLALPRLGGAPNVWNSAMLVYQALLLGGYAYAHMLGKLAVRRQATIHLALLALAALTLPITLANLSPPTPGWEALWVPALLALTIGPVFFLVSAQAPLMQRWFAADSDAGDPYALYAASNLGSFAGLISYPLLFEPNFSLKSQSIAWSAGYGLLFLLVGLTAWARWHAGPMDREDATTSAETIGLKRILYWLALAAVPSGLMLSTTTHLTTDIFAMPLLWVIPLGLYLLSFVPAFSEDRSVAAIFIRPAPLVLLLAGGMAAVSEGGGNMSVALAAVVMLFIIAVALHSRLYDDRPDPSRLTLFYLVMSAGGVLGGLFTALIAPLVFDWVWEHPLLVLAAAALLPLGVWPRWMQRIGSTETRKLVIVGLFCAAAIGLVWVMRQALISRDSMMVAGLMLVIALCGLAVKIRRWAFVLVVAVLMASRGGIDTLAISLDDSRSRSYFGVYTVRDYDDPAIRTLAHGTTLHGKQFLDPEDELKPTSYYGATSGVGIALRSAEAIYGADASVGIVGLGTGTLACYRQPQQTYTFFEIDPAILEYSTRREFTFLPECAPDSETLIGDARLELAALPAEAFDILVIDAFSSDAIPLHLLTMEALDVYERAITDEGVLVFHISNRYIDLRPVLSAAIKERGWYAALRDDNPPKNDMTNGSFWVVMAPDAESLAKVMLSDTELQWSKLGDPAKTAWTDDYASTIPFIQWENLLGSD
ncbi:fused MFS/spermidine synthase [Altererythrobacter sp. ZODW24]|uniref:spermidine synthase n=1 Tax=Altererythrobacter sp. ZODW24 TaxID=2185142 RepID=UPI000DF798A8|nr:fused MFS/spermidine synthase [Altererythrobacter sp. ZODW24]